MKSVSISIVKSILIFALGLGYSTQTAFAQINVKVTFKTGNDDKRGGNKVYLRFNFTNGTSSAEYPVEGGFASNSTVEREFRMSETITSLSQIRNVVLRNDGNPRSGHPFDTYDNWDLNLFYLLVRFGNSSNLVLIHEGGNPLVRFTQQLQSRTFTPIPGASRTSRLLVHLDTGADDKRGGNKVYIRVNYSDGTSSPEFDLGSNGFNANSSNYMHVTLDKSLVSTSEVRSITLRHDGNPRSGHPFDTYDNWDLKGIWVALVFPGDLKSDVIKKYDNPLVRFTGDLRTRTWPRE